MRPIKYQKGQHVKVLCKLTGLTDLECGEEKLPG